MTVAELIDMVRVLGRDATLQDGAILQVLNVAQDDVGRNLRAPIAKADQLSVTTLVWPTNARADGILQVEVLTLDEVDAVTNARTVPIYDARTAAVYEPNYAQGAAAEEARFIVYNPTSAAAPMPIPPPSATYPQSFRVTYVIQPTKMTAMTDEPFGGLLESFHDVLAYRAAWLLGRDQTMAAEYERRIREARGASNQGIVVANNPLYRRTVVTTGRG